MLKRGARSKLKTDGAKLPLTVPDLLPDELAAYRELTAQLDRTGFAQACDTLAVTLAACRLAKVRKVAKLVRGLSALTVTGGNGQPVMHPLIGELRLSERDLADSLRVLNLTPASRKSIRIGNREVPPAVPEPPKGSGKATVLSLMG